MSVEASISGCHGAEWESWKRIRKRLQEQIADSAEAPNAVNKDNDRLEDEHRRMKGEMRKLKEDNSKLKRESYKLMDELEAFKNGPKGSQLGYEDLRKRVVELREQLEVAEKNPQELGERETGR